MKNTDNEKYRDSGTAHRCFGCNASIHTNGAIDSTKLEYICDRTGKEVHECGVVFP